MRSTALIVQGILLVGLATGCAKTAATTASSSAPPPSGSSMTVPTGPRSMDGGTRQAAAVGPTMRPRIEGRQVRAHGGRDEDAGHQRGMVEGEPEAPRADRGPLRRAGHGGVQPRARRAPREGHPELPLRAGRAGRAHLDHLVRRGKAAVLRAQRGVLGEEPPRPFDGQATVKMGGPEMAPHTPPMFGAPRGTRGAPLYTAIYRGSRYRGSRSARAESAGAARAFR